MSNNYKRVRRPVALWVRWLVASENKVLLFALHIAWSIGIKEIDRTFDNKLYYAIQYVKGNNIQGCLAYCDDEVVGWINANTKADCLKCYCWRRFMGSVSTEESNPDIKVKSVFCFAIAPERNYSKKSYFRFPWMIRRTSIFNVFSFTT